MINLTRQKATAIVVAILIVSVVSVTAITMQAYLRSEIDRTKMVLDNDNLFNNLLSGEAWALEIIKSNKINKSDEQTPDNQIAENKTNKVNTIKLHVSNLLKNNIKLDTVILDQSGKFNLNYLYSAKICKTNIYEDRDKILLQVFSNLILFSSVDMNISSEDAKNITYNIVQWLCPLKDKYSTNIVKPTDSDINNPYWEYQTANQFFIDISELKLVPGVTDGIYNSIKNSISALPKLSANKTDLFNMDYITPNVFAALSGVDLDTASEFLKNLDDSNSNGSASDSDKKNNKLKEARQYIKNNNYYNNENDTNIVSKMLYASNNMDTATGSEDSQDKQDVKDSTETTDGSQTQASINTENNKYNYYLIKSVAKNDEYIMGMQTLVATDKKDVTIIWRNREL